jgi:hypothetical protein
MTTVTDAAKRIGDTNDLAELQDADLATICSDPLLAQRIAKQVADLATEVVPGRRWSIEDLRDILDAAVRRRGSDHGRILEGRYFRKRVREQCALSDRYGDPFAVIVMALIAEPEPGMYAGLLPNVVSRLRRGDMVFLYRRRFALVLPRVEGVALSALIERVSELVRTGASADVIERVEGLVYPGEEHTDTQSMLDWAEDQLRTIP